MYDLIIIGGGPAGLTAAIYAARYKLNAIVISAEEGGMAATAHKICNFPSHTTISGTELMQKIKEQALSLGAKILNEAVSGIREESGLIIVATEKNTYKAKKLIIAAGTKRKKLKIKGEEEFYGKGVSYCATCDAAFYKDKSVAVIGGSNASLTAALLLSEFAKEVFIIYRGGKFSAEPMWVESAEKNSKIKMMLNESVKEIIGDKFVSKVLLESGKALDVEGVFIEIGSEPSHLVLKDLKLELDEKGYIIADRSQRTSLKNIFAAGDVTNNSLKQIVTAASEGAVAAFSAYRELVSEKG